MTEKTPLFIFPHIINTGGITLWQTIIREQTSLISQISHLLCKKPLSSNLKQLAHLDSALPLKDQVNQIDPQHLKLVQGHFRFGIHQLFPSRTCRYFTLLREPVDRVISLYFFYLNTYPHKIYREGTQEALSLEEWIDHPKFFQLVCNGQTNIISGFGGMEWHEFQQLSEPYPDTMLEEAKRNLREHFVVVGLMERYDESILLLKKFLNWRFPFYVNSVLLKKRLPRPPVSEETRQKIKALNQLDIELYAYACQLFEEKLRQQKSTFQKEIRQYQAMNRVIGQIYKVIYKLRGG